MLSTKEAILAGFETKNAAGVHYHSFKFGDGYELCMEPTLHDVFMVALYKDGDLLTEKVPAKPLVKSER